MKRFILMIMTLVVASGGPLMADNGVITMGKPDPSAPMLSPLCLIVLPHQYDRKIVATDGFLVRAGLDVYLFATREDARLLRSVNGFRLSFALGAGVRVVEEMNMRYAIVQGTVRALAPNEEAGCAAFINDVTYMQVGPPFDSDRAEPKGPKKEEKKE